MRLTQAICFAIMFQAFVNIATAQRNLVYSNYYVNPFLYNPSFIAPNGYTELFLNYRRQWVGFQGAPVTATANFHFPVNYKMGLGASFIQDQAGVLKTTTGLLSFGYQIYLGKDKSIPHKIAFGLSAGITNSNVNITEASNPLDPAVANNKTSSMDGQFGMHYQNKNLRIGFAIPRLFRSYITSPEDFNTPGLQQITSTISTISYNFNIGSRLSFEPTAMYRTEKNAPTQWEALGVLSFDRLVWAGGSYRQDYGAGAFFGLSIKGSLKVAYAYEFATGQTNNIGNGSHEIQLAIKLGKKKAAPVAKQQTVPAVVTQTTTPQSTTEQTTRPAEVQTTVAEKKTEPVEQQQTEPTSKSVQQQPVTVQQNDQGASTVVTDTTSADQKPKKLTGETLGTGHYVVVGAFFSVHNAKNYCATLRQTGYPAEVAFYPLKKYYIVHMKNAATLDEAKKLRDFYRAKSRYSFRDTWILTVD